MTLQEFTDAMESMWFVGRKTGLLEASLFLMREAERRKMYELVELSNRLMDMSNALHHKQKEQKDEVGSQEDREEEPGC